MLARGCVVNGANTILIDVNEVAMKEVEDETKKLAEDAGFSALKTIPSVLLVPL